MTRVRSGALCSPRRVGAALVALALAACAFPIRTKYEADPAADFAQYRSYAWALEEAAPAAGERHGGHVSPLDEQRIVRAVDEALVAKGYRKLAAIEGADLVVSYAIGIEEKTRVTRYPSSTIRGHPDFGYGEWYSNTETRVETHDEGTLSIEFYDRRTKQAVWVGWAQKRLERGTDSEEVLRKAVAAVLAEFPDRG
jgi:hypothetical protein